MMIYLLKSSACLAILLMFYQIFLERENIHRFKRYYLLAAIVVALGIPFITFTEYVTAPTQQAPVIIAAENSTAPIPRTEATTIPWTLILWYIYGVGALVFGFKFLMNLSQIIYDIRTNPNRKVNSIIQVLLQKSVVPHTFFRYIFLNRQKFESGQIPEEVIVHEKAHARQWHSLDVLFVELLQVVFWFHPLVYWAKYHIKLNHEFLADQAVLNHGTNTSNYQNILLTFASSANSQENQPNLANAINYSSIRLTLFGTSFTIGRSTAGQVKKRFTVMKSHTSKKSVFIRSLFLLPILALLIYGFSSKEHIYKNSTAETESRIHLNNACDAIEHQTIRIQKNGLLINGKKFDTSMAWLSYLRTEYGGSLEEGLPEMHFNLINEDDVTEDIDGILSAFSGGAWQVHQSVANQQQSPNPIENNVPTEKDFKSWKNKDTFAIWIHKKSVDNSILNNYKPSDFAHYFLSFVHQNARSKKFPQPYQVHLYSEEEFKEIVHSNDRLIEILINKNGQLLIRSEIVGLENLDTYLKGLNKHLSKKERQDVVHAIIVADESAPKEILATVENTLDAYGVAQIDIRGPKSTSPVPALKKATEQQIKEYNSLIESVNKKPENKRIFKKETIERLKYIYGLMTVQQKREAALFPKFPEPPVAPTPPESPNKSSSQTPPSPPPPAVKPDQAVNQKIPPPPPPYKVPDSKKHTKVLIKAFKRFDKKAIAYGSASEAYVQKGKGTIPQLQQLYEEVMVLYDDYVDLAVKEGLMQRTRKNSDVEIQGGAMRSDNRPLQELSSREDYIVERQSIKTADKKVEMVPLRSNIEKQHIKNARRLRLFMELYGDCNEFFYKGTSISFNDVITMYLKLLDLELESKSTELNGLVVKCQMEQTKA